MESVGMENAAGHEPTFVVGVGASAGGLEALERFFSCTPLDTGMAFVVVQHLSPDFKSLMEELLGRITKLDIVRVTERVALRANTIYLMSPSRELVLDQNELVPVSRLDQVVPLPISRFLSSLARERRSRAIGVILSGTGSDGSIGIADVHASGGLVLAQTEATAKFDGMPRSAVATGYVDKELAPEEMAAFLVRYSANPAEALAVPPIDKSALSSDECVAAMFARLRDQYGVDFHLYKSVTVFRRIHRRMELSHCRSIESYCQLALDDAAELDALCRDLLIGVTRFFRDPDAFVILAERVVPDIIQKLPENGGVRVWVPGCATGEEPYSLAMLFLAECEKQGRSPDVRVFASDVHRGALRTAAEGLYTEQSVEMLPPELRDRFFTREPDGRLRVTAGLRKAVLFSEHNVLKDVPFNRIDLVSCRNLLIYFEREPQARALASFHFALKPHGTLFLGPSESLGELEQDFAIIDRVARLYRKTSESRLPANLKLRLPGRTAVMPPRMSAASEASLRRVYDNLLSRFMPPSVLVSDRREVLHVFGDASAYLRAPRGRASLDVVSMCDGDLRVAVASALAGAGKRGERVVLHGVRSSADPSGTILDVVAEPLEDGDGSSRQFLLQFIAPRTLPTPVEVDAVSLTEDMRTRFRTMETELRDTRESLQNTIEDLETANEELQASNEELLAGNEEMQSTNEELQSVNEELYTVNAEYNLKNKELAAATADLRNLIVAAHTGVVFTDAEGIVRLYTPGATQVLNLMPQDVGRPLSHVTSRIPDDSLLRDLREVTESHRSVETTIRLEDGRYFLRRVLPYEAPGRSQAGVVVTFLDVTERKQVELLAQERMDMLKATIDVSPSQIVVVDKAGVIVATNRAWDKFGDENGGRPGSSLIGSSYFSCGEEDAVARDAFRMVREVLSGDRPDANLDYLCSGPNGDRWFWMNVARLPLTQGGAVIAHTDITTRKLSEAMDQKLLETAKLESLGILAGGVAHDFNNILTGILGNVSLATEDVPKDSPVHALLADVGGSALRAAELCKQMLVYAGRSEFKPKLLQVGSLVAETSALVRAAVNKKTRLELALAEALPEVLADAAQLRQVVMNLAINGSEALPAEGGVVTIRTSLAPTPAVVKDEVVIVATTRPHEPHVCVEATDTGCGIERGILLRIFEPFFTTKFTGRGLGLAAVLGIVRGHHGALYVRSTPKVGTTFRMLLPTATPLNARRDGVARTPLEVRGEGTRVLVIDDEEGVRRTICRMLERSGYVCDGASDGTQGLEQLMKSPGTYQAIVLDLTMPGLDGVQTFHRLRKVDQATPVLMISAFPESEVTDRFQGAVVPDGFLQKPLELDALRSAVAAILQTVPAEVG